MSATCADLFAGAGGMSLGFCEAGFAHVLGVDRDEDAVATYRENIGDAMRADVFDRHARRQIAEELRGRVDVLIAGPPCQPFSQAGKQQGEADTRDGWPAFLRMVALLRPQVVVAENVARLAHEPNRPYFSRLLERLATRGYHVRWRVLDAADYGVPQHRKRVFIVAFRDVEAARAFQWPLPTHSATGDMWTRRHVSAGEALLPRIAHRAPDPKGLPQWLRPASQQAECDAANQIRGVTGGWAIPNRERQAALYNGAPGGDRGVHVAVLHDAKDHRRRYERGYGEKGQNWQSLDLPAFTITASGGQRHRLQLGDHVWKLDFTDSAALQGFPSAFRWIGRNSESRSRLVGNAVPPPLAKAIATEVMVALNAAALLHAREPQRVNAIACETWHDGRHRNDTDTSGKFPESPGSVRDTTGRGREGKRWRIDA